MGGAHQHNPDGQREKQHPQNQDNMGKHIRSGIAAGHAHGGGDAVAWLGHQ
jgi:hypothetical protein